VSSVTPSLVCEHPILCITNMAAPLPVTASLCVFCVSCWALQPVVFYDHFYDFGLKDEIKTLLSRAHPLQDPLPLGHQDLPRSGRGVRGHGGDNLVLKLGALELDTRRGRTTSWGGGRSLWTRAGTTSCWEKVA